ncbi:hypothetical protein SAMN05216302_101450 [Nitrosomonas aestuarii]|uniref:Uncharacterized protein n=1 Tax=Nitrosomonas aestuarii TaxID=52441 RepID=A0A1I4C1C4_9PROT|nr:hypothetical protein [Nitrosomonas aestuarii]SFK74878.1 hypothetical protein SAMN05216302_101450 [Nitrosomonas aestuarii]
MIDESVVVSRLSRWARIKLETGVKLGYPSESAFRKFGPPGHSHVRDMGVDLEFQQTEEAFKLLPEIPQLVIRKEFLSTCKNEAAKAYQLGIAVRTFRQYKHNAYTMLSNILNLRLTDGAEKMYKSANF